MDADIILEEDASAVARPWSSRERGSRGRRYHPGRQRLRGRQRRVVRSQDQRGLTEPLVEYLGFLLAGRTGWSVLNCLLYNLRSHVRRQDLIDASDTLTTPWGYGARNRMHRTLRGGVARSPSSRSVLDGGPATIRQRRRQRDHGIGVSGIHPGTRKMLLNPRQWVQVWDASLS